MVFPGPWRASRCCPQTAMRAPNRLRWAGRYESGHGSTTDRRQVAVMEQWALVLADSMLLVVALVGAVLTLVRMRRIGGFPAVLAGTACGVLVVAAIFDM